MVNTRADAGVPRQYDGQQYPAGNGATVGAALLDCASATLFTGNCRAAPPPISVLELEYRPKPRATLR